MKDWIVDKKKKKVTYKLSLGVTGFLAESNRMIYLFWEGQGRPTFCSFASAYHVLPQWDLAVFWWVVWISYSCSNTILRTFTTYPYSPHKCSCNSHYLQHSWTIGKHSFSISFLNFIYLFLLQGHTEKSDRPSYCLLLASFYWLSDSIW